MMSGMMGMMGKGYEDDDYGKGGMMSGGMMGKGGKGYDDDSYGMMSGGMMGKGGKGYDDDSYGVSCVDCREFDSNNSSPVQILTRTRICFFRASFHSQKGDGGMMSGGMMGKGYDGGDTKDDDYGVSYLSIDICSIAKTPLVYKIFNTNSNIFFALPFIRRKEKVV
jgi:hypothetical protein